MAYGNAVERMVARDVAKSPVLRQIFRAVSKPGKLGPDFEGLGPASGQIFDITTPGSMAAHLGRSYGPLLRVVTYVRPPGVAF